MSNLIEALHKAMIDQPGDPLPKLAYADLLAERGEQPDLVRGLRYAARHGRHPEFFPHLRPRGEWTWMASTHRYGGRADRPFQLPYALVAAMPDCNEAFQAGHGTFDEAMAAIGRALAKLEEILRGEFS